MTHNEAIENLDLVVGEIKSTHDSIINETRQLETILINLKIESARIKENNGIKPIAETLERIVNVIKNDIQLLKSNHRDRLNESLDVIKKYKGDE